MKRWRTRQTIPGILLVTLLVSTGSVNAETVCADSGQGDKGKITLGVTPDVICVNHSATVTATLRKADDGAPDPGVPVSFTSEPAGAFAPSGTVTSDPATGKATVTFTAKSPGTYKIKADAGGKSGYGTAGPEDVIVMKIQTVLGDQEYYKVDNTGSVINLVGAKKAKGSKLTLSAYIDPNTQEARGALSWDGATMHPSNKLQATVPIDKSEKKTIVVKVSNTPCQEVRVWPTWATVGNFRGDNAQGQDLSKNNDCELPSEGLGIAPTNKWFGTRNQCEIKATIIPQGVSALGGVQFDFKRTKEAKSWKKKAGDKKWTVQAVYPAGSDDDPDNEDEDLHDRNDVVWVIDAPGFAWKRTESWDFRVQEAEFIESLHLILNQKSNRKKAISGTLISNELKWYSIVNCKKDPQEKPKNARWVRNTDRLNHIREGDITIGDQPHETMDE